ncbi:MAG: undecaprenyl-diphosphate phosphatase [Treponemataceae bacterium]|nr:undecaprenyl-diphosphate phosphatase [Treponemataceae bacterium]
MTIIQGILLGILQGVAEFLPISSSGHLTLAQHLFGLDQVPLLFDVFLHIATLAAVLLYFRKKVWKLLKIFGRWIAHHPEPENTELEDDYLMGTDKAGRKTIIAIIVTTAITGVIGIVTSKLIPELPVEIICIGFIITALLLILSSLLSRKQIKEAAQRGVQDEAPKGISLLQSIVIGLMQGLGTLPGISRSGSTIAGALFSKVDRKAAGDYSFIVSIPAILGAFILELKDLGDVSETVGALPLVAGCLAAFAVGYISLVLLMKLIRRGKLQWFACYLIPIAILGLIFLR